MARWDATAGHHVSVSCFCVGSTHPSTCFYDMRLGLALGASLTHHLCCDLRDIHICLLRSLTLNFMGISFMR